MKTRGILVSPRASLRFRGFLRHVKTHVILTVVSENHRNPRVVVCWWESAAVGRDRQTLEGALISSEKHALVQALAGSAWWRYPGKVEGSSAPVAPCGACFAGGASERRWRCTRVQRGGSQSLRETASASRSLLGLPVASPLPESMDSQRKYMPPALPTRENKCDYPTLEKHL